jgi:hypothetical protein
MGLKVKKNKNHLLLVERATRPFNKWHIDILIIFENRIFFGK